jgi:hypothetical protein
MQTPVTGCRWGQPWRFLALCGGPSDEAASEPATPGQRARRDTTIEEFVEHVKSYLMFETEDKWPEL